MIAENRIKKNLRKFSFPRLSGTKYELEAFNHVKSEIENLNLDFEVQNFTFSSFYSRTYPKVAFTSGSLIFFTLYLKYHLIVSTISLVLFGFILISSVLMTRKPEKIRFLKNLNSQNLLVKIKSISNKLKSNERIALFISHLDSKSQKFTIRLRIRMIKLWIATTIILGCCLPFRYLINWRFMDLFYVIAMFPLIMNLFSALLIILNITSNKSEGAVDNASGIACNLELLNHYSNKKNRLSNYDMWFLFTGAEECGTMGVRHFYNTLKQYNPKLSVVFNFESIAHNVFLFPGGQEGDNAQDINFLLLNNTRNLKIQHYITNRVLGAHSDGGFLGDKGFQGYGIGEVDAYSYMHTPNDTLDKINTGILKKLCLVLTDSLKKHDSTFFD
ncbi:MAG: M28 family peptidase [Candidatus Lokiarchaeota archaeon]|nr:M28 family peptidase [Candidatus Lokiarchaeota archaeon]